MLTIGLLMVILVLTGGAVIAGLTPDTRESWQDGQHRPNLLP